MMKAKKMWILFLFLTAVFSSFVYANALEKARAAQQRGNDLYSRMENERAMVSRLASRLRETAEQSHRIAEEQKREIEKIRKGAAAAQRDYETGLEKASALKRDYDLLRKEKERKEAFYEALHQTVVELRKGQHQIEPVNPRSEKEQEEFEQLLNGKERSLETAFQDLSATRKKFLQASATRAQFEQVELPTLRDKVQNFADQLRASERKLKGVPGRQLSGFEKHEDEQYEAAKREVERFYEDAKKAYKEAQLEAKKAFDDAKSLFEKARREREQVFKEKEGAWSQYKISNDTWEKEARKKVSSKQWDARNKRLTELKEVILEGLARANKATERLAEKEGEIVSSQRQMQESESVQKWAQSRLIALEQNRPK